MLNHAIDNLNTKQENAYLQVGLTPFCEYDNAGRSCHFGMLDRAAPAAVRNGPPELRWTGYYGAYDGLLIDRFNTLCMKLGGAPREQWSSSLYYRYPTANDLCGAAKLGQLIRARILENRARRILGSVAVGVEGQSA